MKSRGTPFVMTAVAALLLTPSLASAQGGRGGENAQAPQRSIREIAPNVFYYQNNRHAQAFQETVKEVIAHVNMPASAKRDMCVRIHSIP